MSLSSLAAWGCWEKRIEGPGGGREGVIALRTIREIAFSDCARPQAKPGQSLSSSLFCLWLAAGGTPPGPSTLVPPSSPTKPSPPQACPNTLNDAHARGPFGDNHIGRLVGAETGEVGHLHAGGGHWQVVIHLCHAWRKVFQVPRMPLDLWYCYSIGRVGHQDVREQVSALLGHFDMRRELILHL